jgi:hypothetical protein
MDHVVLAVEEPFADDVLDVVKDPKSIGIGDADADGRGAV